MLKHCPNCKTENSINRFTCSQCGEELFHGGSEMEALTYWEERDTGNRHVFLCRVIMIAAAGLSILIHHAIPLLIGAFICVLIYLKDWGRFGP